MTIWKKPTSSFHMMWVDVEIFDLLHFANFWLRYYNSSLVVCYNHNYIRELWKRQFKKHAIIYLSFLLDLSIFQDQTIMHTWYQNVERF